MRSGLKRRPSISEKNIKPTPYRESIEGEDFKTFIAAGWVDCSCINDLTEIQIVECVVDVCTKKATGEELHLVDHAAKVVMMSMQFYIPEDRVLL